MVQVYRPRLAFRLSAEGEEMPDQFPSTFGRVEYLLDMTIVGSACFLFRRSNSAYPNVTARRLLKSWAMPPASVPVRFHLLRLGELPLKPIVFRDIAYDTLVSNNLSKRIET